jgi:hypothetical protein
MRKGTVAFTAAAVLAVAAAGAIRFVFLPTAEQLPANLDAQVHYAGTASLLNPAALASGDAAHAFLKDLPVTGTHRVRVTGVSGSTALLSDEVTLVGPQGKTLSKASHLYAVDRSSLAAVPAPSGSTVDDHQGLVLFPLSPSKGGYQLWDPTTRRTAQAHYVRTETRAGRQTYVYSMHSAGPVRDKATLAALPPAIPKATLVALAPGLSATQRTGLNAVLPMMPSVLPLVYESTSDTTAWVDATTGAAIDSTQTQSIVADLNIGTGSTELTPVLSVDLKATQDSVSAIAGDSAHIAGLLFLITWTVPLGLLALAIVLGALAVWSDRRAHIRASAPAQLVEEPANS